MPAYRAYFLRNRHILGPPEIIEADDDAAALEQARRFVDGHDVEVWQEDRCVGYLKHEEQLS